MTTVCKHYFLVCLWGFLNEVNIWMSWLNNESCTYSCWGWQSSVLTGQWKEKYPPPSVCTYTVCSERMPLLPQIISTCCQLVCECGSHSYKGQNVNPMASFLGNPEEYSLIIFYEYSLWTQSPLLWMMADTAVSPMELLQGRNAWMCEKPTAGSFRGWGWFFFYSLSLCLQDLSSSIVYIHCQSGSTEDMVSSVLHSEISSILGSSDGPCIW